MTAHVSVSRWGHAPGVLKCHSCKDPILAGEAVRFVGPQALPHCTKCAKHRFDMEPPPAESTPAPKQRFSFATAADLANDFKRAQGKDDSE
jgi:hypothetical protein